MDELKIDQDFYDAFRKLLLALKDYNKEIVIIGGFANALYEYHKYGQKSELGVLATKDIDVLTSRKVTVVNKTILDRLKEQGFKVDPKPIEGKAITKFTLPGTNFEIEFLCPMYGSELNRKGKRQIVTEIQKDVTAQPLRYLDIALFDTWIVPTKKIPELSDLDMKIQIPNPGAYLIQKFIIKDKRKPAYAQKDCFYIYELLLKFKNNLKIVGNCIDNIVGTNASRGQYKKIRKFKDNFKTYFATRESEGILRAHQELLDRGYDDIAKTDIVAMFSLFIDML